MKEKLYCNKADKKKEATHNAFISDSGKVSFGRIGSSTRRLLDIGEFKSFIESFEQLNNKESDE